MNNLKLSVLNSLALHCGYPTATTKLARIAATSIYDKLYTSLGKHTPLNVLSVDIGIKNFSYCKATYSSIHLDLAQLHEWNHLNLHDKFGAGYTLQTGDENSLVDLKGYMAKLAVDVVDEIFCGGWLPNLITIENQRTRSNGNTSTLPNVLLNFTLENMLYAACRARKLEMGNVSVVPVNASKMMNFWVLRFIGKGQKLCGSRSKSLRTQLLYGWLALPENAPFKVQGLEIPLDFAGLSMRAKNNVVLDQLNFDTRPKKVDDLVDCYLYNMMSVVQLRRHAELKRAIESDQDLVELICKWDAEHCKFLDPILAQFNLELNIQS